MPGLVLGPLLRYVGEDSAVLWVETDAPCEVEVLGGRERTFSVDGHHYALVCAEGLETGARHEYQVLLDGEQAWPLPDSDFPPSGFRTPGRGAAAQGKPLQIVFGSCRVAAPHIPPYCLRKDQDERGREVDALRGLSRRMRDQPREDWPDVLLMLGDQVYADEASPAVREFIRRRRGTKGEAGDDVLDYEEYAQLYLEAWGDEEIRWLLSSVSTAMIFDDHDVHDDWNTSAAWVAEMREGPMWEEHMIGALMSYWVYQHLGNLSPSQLAQNEMYARAREADGDAAPLLREFASKADQGTEGARWSYCRDLGDTRLVVIDSRAGRVLDEGSRSMLDEAEWRWLDEHVQGGHDHVLLATSLPWLLMPAMHDLEAWNEAVCGGAWGGAAARQGEKVRQGLDLEHWAAFNESFRRLAETQRSLGAGERGEPPATIITLSGDVHHAYLHEVAFPRGSGVRSGVFQAVCSPFRNPLDSRERRGIKAMTTAPARALCRALARAAGVEAPPVRWRQVGDGPWFDNQFSTLRLDGRRIELTIDKAMPEGEHGDVRLERVFARRLA